MCAVTVSIRLEILVNTSVFIINIVRLLLILKFFISGCKSLKLKQLKLEPKDEKVHIVSLSDGVDHFSVK